MIAQNTLRDILTAYDADAPLEEASTIPGPWYVDARIAELEATAVFSRTWQMVGRAEQVAVRSAGDRGGEIALAPRDHARV